MSPFNIAISVNGHQTNGSVCPLPTYHSYPCPNLCVRDISLCPSSVRPTCEQGLTFCVDGSCRSTCPPNLVSSCSCPGAPSLHGNIYPCQNTQTVDIPNFDASQKDTQTIQTCSSNMGLSGVTEWVPNPYQIMWGNCPTPDYGTLNFHEPVFIALYVFYGSCVASLVGWTIYKRLREKVHYPCHWHNNAMCWYMYI